MARLQVSGLTKQFGSVKALDHVSLTVEEGEFVSLLGPSGCGKTTILRCLAGLEGPDSGEIRIGESLVVGPGKFIQPENRGVGMVFQSYAIWPHMTVLDNLAFGLTLKKLPQAEIRSRIDAALKTVGLTGLEKRYPSQLSGGQQQRVAVARALVLKPKVLLFDEPLSNLDAKLRERMREEIRAIQQELKITTVYVTHDQSEAMAMSDRIVLLNHGHIVQSGSPQELYYTPANRFAADFVGMCNFLPGYVLQKQADGRCLVGLGNDRPVPVHPDPSLEPGCRVSVLVRLEQMEVTRPKETEQGSGWPGRVLKRLFQGDNALYEVDCEGVTIWVRAWSGVLYQVGETVTLFPRQKEFHALPEIEIEAETAG